VSRDHETAVRERTFRRTVPAGEGGQRLDRYLARQSFLPTRSRIAALIRDGNVTVDGVVRKASFLVSDGAHVDVRLPPPEPSWVEPEELELDVLYEDDALIAIDKPAGMASHPAPGTRRGTLVAALLHRWRFAGDWPDPQRPGIVHRLDKDTTGVMVVAKTPVAMHALARQFARRSVRKRYEAIVVGAPRDTHGVIDLAIGRDPVDRKRMQARVGQTRHAVTRYAVREVLGDPPCAAWLSLEPETGRTHQIRVHLASIGHGIVGDRVYGSGRAPASAASSARAAIEAFPRQALHAASLSFRHPSDGREIELVAPLAPDMLQLLDELRSTSARGDVTRKRRAASASRDTPRG
jgi:23S rRNA pseudouridine1911/1915/1917 synthase